MTLEDGPTDKYRLSLGGIAAPKEGEERATKKMKRPDALEHSYSCAQYARTPIITYIP